MVSQFYACSDHSLAEVSIPVQGGLLLLDFLATPYRFLPFPVDWGGEQSGSTEGSQFHIFPLPSALRHDPGSSGWLESPGVGLRRGRGGDHAGSVL